jgi:hypothetical protein
MEALWQYGKEYREWFEMEPRDSHPSVYIWDRFAADVKAFVLEHCRLRLDRLIGPISSAASVALRQNGRVPHVTDLNSRRYLFPTPLF